MDCALAAYPLLIFWIFWQNYIIRISHRTEVVTATEAQSGSALAEQQQETPKNLSVFSWIIQQSNISSLFSFVEKLSEGVCAGASACVCWAHAANFELFSILSHFTLCAHVLYHSDRRKKTTCTHIKKSRNKKQPRRAGEVGKASLWGGFYPSSCFKSSPERQSASLLVPLWGCVVVLLHRRMCGPPLAHPGW